MAYDKRTVQVTTDAAGAAVTDVGLGAVFARVYRLTIESTDASSDYTIEDAGDKGDGANRRNIFTATGINPSGAGGYNKNLKYAAVDSAGGAVDYRDGAGTGSETGVIDGGLFRGPAKITIANGGNAVVHTITLWVEI